jgi:2-oxoglutarate ferredoxin oxidoreductase subunit alpha
MKRTTLKIAGESGMGLASVGTIIAKTLKRMNFQVHLDREYPSLIKGGHSNMQIDFGAEPMHCLSNSTNIVVALDRAGLEEYLGTIKEGGILIHGYERHQLIKDLESRAKKRKVKLLYLPARQIAYSFGGNELMTNMVLLGLLWRVLGFDRKELEEEVKERYGKNPDILAKDLLCLDAGYKAEGLKNLVNFKIEKPRKKLNTILLDGNHAITLGAIHAGVRAYYAYPMSPSSSILTYMANWALETKMVVKQGEDEITVAQMTIGSMFAGTRALAATSGGGYDLMTESVSMAAMIECPLVIVIAQRPGPATGLPTWTAQADLNLAIHSAHGEFPRVVIAASDPLSCFETIQHAFNLAEVYQIPVLVLTEKVIAESQSTVAPFKQNTIPIQHGLVTDKKELAKLQRSDRYKITASGVSKRWNPGSSEAFYFANSDEHGEDGTLTEDSEPVARMQAKRMRKQEAVAKVIPEPKIFGPKKADISFIGWGSSKGAVIDAMEVLKEKGVSVNYLHYEFMWPFKDKTVRKFFKENKNVHLIEGNMTGQLGTIIEQHTGLKFKNKFLKYDGRPFFLEEVVEYATRHSEHSEGIFKKL